jgi:hypothetical protein
LREYLYSIFYVEKYVLRCFDMYIRLAMEYGLNSSHKF